MNNDNKILRMPRGTIKDRLLKYNILKLLVCAVIIFGGIFLIWGAYFGYFSKAVFVNKDIVYDGTAVVETMMNEGKYYYEIVKEELTEEQYYSIINKIPATKDKSFVKDNYVKYKTGYKLKKDINREQYDKLFSLLKNYDGTVKNIHLGYNIPENAMKDSTFPVIFEINNPDNHIIPKKMSTRTVGQLRNFIINARRFNFFAMFWTPFIPILGFLWLTASVKHTYKRQQELDKNI